MNAIYGLGVLAAIYPFFRVIAQILEIRGTIPILLLAIAFALMWPIILGIIATLSVIRYRSRIFR